MTRPFRAGDRVYVTAPPGSSGSWNHANRWGIVLDDAAPAMDDASYVQLDGHPEIFWYFNRNITWHLNQNIAYKAPFDIGDIVYVTTPPFGLDGREDLSNRFGTVRVPPTEHEPHEVFICLDDERNSSFWWHVLNVEKSDVVDDGSGTSEKALLSERYPEYFNMHRAQIAKANATYEGMKRDRDYWIDCAVEHAADIDELQSIIEEQDTVLDSQDEYIEALEDAVRRLNGAVRRLNGELEEDA